MSDEYDGLLKRRLMISILTAAGSELDEYCRAVDEREAALFDHFGIDRATPNAWRDLALALARRHVPAFMPRPGRPATSRDETIRLFLASLYFQRHDGIAAAAGDARAATHFNIDEKTVKNRLKDMRRQTEYKEDGPLLTFIAVNRRAKLTHLGGL